MPTLIDFSLPASDQVEKPNFVLVGACGIVPEFFVHTLRRKNAFNKRAYNILAPSLLVP
jgi:hypothetical protein